MGFTIQFIALFAYAVVEALPLLLFFILLILVMGLFVGRKEGWSRFDAFYWAFITAFTVGYGDIRPKKRGSRLIALFITLTGVMLTGVVVSLAVTAAGLAYKNNHPPIVESIKQRISSDGSGR